MNTSAQTAILCHWTIACKCHCHWPLLQSILMYKYWHLKPIKLTNLYLYNRTLNAQSCLHQVFLSLKIFPNLSFAFSLFFRHVSLENIRNIWKYFPTFFCSLAFFVATIPLIYEIFSAWYPPPLERSNWVDTWKLWHERLNWRGWRGLTTFEHANPSTAWVSFKYISTASFHFTNEISDQLLCGIKLNAKIMTIVFFPGMVRFHILSLMAYFWVFWKQGRQSKSLEAFQVSQYFSHSWHQKSDNDLFPVWQHTTRVRLSVPPKLLDPAQRFNCNQTWDH